MVYGHILTREILPLSIPILNLHWHSFLQTNIEVVCLFYVKHIECSLCKESDIIENEISIVLIILLTIMMLADVYIYIYIYNSCLCAYALPI